MAPLFSIPLSFQQMENVLLDLLYLRLRQETEWRFRNEKE